VFQDNQSAMLLEKNGRGSSSKRTRHINIRYFFITDRIAKDELTVEYCPTGDMVGDFFTKALQGSLFRKFRALIMNIKNGDVFGSSIESSQECVGSNVITGKTPEVVTGKIPVTGKTKNTSTGKNTKKVTNENQENIPITTKSEPRNAWFAPRPKANPLKSILRSKR
jgi:hypothetical protein